MLDLDEKEIRRCPYYHDDPVKSCKAYNGGLRVPTHQEEIKVCLSGHYYKCSLFKKKEMKIEKNLGK